MLMHESPQKQLSCVFLWIFLHSWDEITNKQTYVMWCNWIIYEKVCSRKAFIAGTSAVRISFWSQLSATPFFGNCTFCTTIYSNLRGIHLEEEKIITFTTNRTCLTFCLFLDTLGVIAILTPFIVYVVFMIFQVAISDNEFWWMLMLLKVFEPIEVT